MQYFSLLSLLAWRRALAHSQSSGGPNNQDGKSEIQENMTIIGSTTKARTRGSGHAKEDLVYNLNCVGELANYSGGFAHNATFPPLTF